MAGGRESSFKHHKYKGMSSSRTSRPDNFINEDDPEEVIISQIKNKYHHLRRVADGESRPNLRQHPPDEIFASVYPEFLNFYSRGQLQHLEKLFLMADQDQDCRLSKFEVKYWMEKQGNPISQCEAKQIFCVADEDKDGYLSFREFLLFCKRIELKNIPSHNQDLRVRRMVEDPTGQSICYPPNYPENGVDKMMAKLKSFTQVRGNIGGAVQFFESEIAKESESAERGRRMYSQNMDGNSSRGSLGCSREAYSCSNDDAAWNAQKNRYRTSLNVQHEEQHGRSENPQHFRSSFHLEPEPMPFQSQSPSDSLKSESENSRNYRTSLYMEPKPVPFQNRDSTDEYSHVAQNTYNPSLPFAIQPYKNSAGVNNVSANRRSTGFSSVSSKNAETRGASANLQNLPFYNSSFSSSRNGSILNENGNEKQKRASSIPDKQTRKSTTEDNKAKTSIRPSTSPETEVIYRETASPVLSEHKLRSEYSIPRFENIGDDTFEEEPVDQSKSPKTKNSEPLEEDKETKNMESNKGDEYPPGQLVEPLVKPTTRGSFEVDTTKTHRTSVLKSEKVSIGTQTNAEEKQRKVSVWIQTNEAPTTHSAAAQTNSLETLDESSNTPAYETIDERIETDDKFDTPNTSEFALL